MRVPTKIQEYPVDVLVYATGFRFMYTGTFNRITGRTPGVSLSEKWSSGTKTFIGTQVSGFPNMYILAGPQAAGAFFNFVSGIEAGVRLRGQPHEAHARRGD